jgi:transposase
MAGVKSEMRKYSQKPEEVRGRWLKWVALKENGMNCNQIARIYGVRHTTVHYALKRVQEIIDIYGKY